MLESKHERVIKEFESVTKDAGRVQIETLKRILEMNGEAEYLQSLGLCGRTDPESFKACVPLATHSDLEPYIQRITDGEDSPILTGKPITTISLSAYEYVCMGLVEWLLPCLHSGVADSMISAVDVLRATREIE
ncbi:putative indole-3-acetic acid-amido synthetase GH3.5 [Acorus calamus]|uniref:Indole-3-acetic acid-amido synthetase GH3.5 n=1 Tax=Acorus calamus TaxID=4465 RepID=A0AAV9FJJ3_ACOCL|nr:putative indole-3-acetic acid-amido synthetase GH3.5 [Acorus calamus]